MKRIVRLITVALIALCILGVEKSHSTDLRVITEEWPPFNYTISGRPAGLSVQLIQEALKRMGDHSRIEYLPWNRGYRIALEEPNVLIFTMARTKERENLFKWVAPIAPRELYFYKMAGRKDITVNSIDDLKKYIVGVASEADAITQDLVAHGLKIGEHLQPMHGHERLNLLKLMRGRIDLVAYSPIRLRFDADIYCVSPQNFEKTFKMPTKDEQYYFAFSRTTPDAIVNQLKNVIQDMHDDGTFEAIMRKHR